MKGIGSAICQSPKIKIERPKKGSYWMIVLKQPTLGIKKTDPADLYVDQVFSVEPFYFSKY
jgi:hypothetical protein